MRSHLLIKLIIFCYRPQFICIKLIFIVIFFRHGHFISSSQLATHSPILDSPILGSVNPSTSGHFTRSLSLLVNLLSHHTTPYDSQILLLRWVLDIIEQLKTTGQIYQSQEFTSLIQTLVSLGKSTYQNNIF